MIRKIYNGRIIMKVFGYESTEERARPAIKRRSQVDRAKAGSNHRLDAPVTSANKPVHKRLSIRGHYNARHSLLLLQQSCGNHCAQRALELSKKAEGQTGVNFEVERKIESVRGAGQPLDSVARVQMEKAFNADFSGVRVHTNSDAGALNRELNARAFTTGQDIFFRQGEYNPGGSSGRELLAHELTHVVQQNAEHVRRKTEDGEAGPSYGCGTYSGLGGSVQGKLSIGRPGDIYEQEADQTARNFTLWEQRANPSSERGPGVLRQGVEEENEEETTMRGKPQENALLRQPEKPEKEEEEAARMKLNDSVVHRQTQEEEDVVK
jgi:hypothetical protein